MTAKHYRDADGYPFTLTDVVPADGPGDDARIGVAAPAKGTFWLNAKIARALAADLLAFADASDT